MALEVIGVKRSYGDFSVSLDFTVEKGETLALVGPSGSGKTTALNLIAGLAELEEGKILIDGEDSSLLPCWKRNISVVFQDLALFPHLDVGGNIAYGLRVRKVPQKEQKKIVDSTLELVRLQGYASRRIHTLSGGEKQRVAIARSLACNPSALLLDEPFSSLDAPLRKVMRREFLDIRSRSGAPCVFVTHDREEAAMLGDRLALMSNGRIVETGTAREIFLTPKTEFAASFFGAGLLLPCKVLTKREAGTSSEASCGTFSEASREIEVSTPLGNLIVPCTSMFEPRPQKLFIPHDAISLQETHEHGWKFFHTRCGGVIFEGSKQIIKLLLSEGAMPLEVIAGPRTPPPAQGSAVKLWLDQSLLRFVKGDD